MSQWDGKSKGTLLGYKIFVYCIKKLGIRSAYSVLVFVAFYYFVAYPKNFKAMYAYFRNRQNFSFFKSVLGVYKNYFVFGQKQRKYIVTTFSVKFVDAKPCI